jgi:hypothetical protein
MIAFCGLNYSCCFDFCMKLLQAGDQHWYVFGLDDDKRVIPMLCLLPNNQGAIRIEVNSSFQLLGDNTVLTSAIIIPIEIVAHGQDFAPGSSGSIINYKHCLFKKSLPSLPAILGEKEGARQLAGCEAHKGDGTSSGKRHT